MMPLTFVMVCEAQPDFRVAATLADRVLCEHVDWIHREVLDTYRQFKGIRPESTFLTWAECAQLSRSLGRRVHGHFDGKPGDLDALAGRKAILVALTQFRDLRAIFLIRDSDGLVGRKEGLGQSRSEITSRDFEIVIGVAHCKREAWVLAGFQVRDEEDERQLKTLRQELGFDPCHRAHELDASHDHDKRSAKRVLGLLVRGDKSREGSCTEGSSIKLLQQYGELSGLASYINEVTNRIVPLFRDGRFGG